MRLIDPYALPRTPWKNGGGETCTVAIVPDNAGFDDFDWRVSIAEVRESGPFSLFPGMDRVIMLLSGSGMMLNSHVLRVPFEPFSFRGEESIHAELIDGPSRDFNVMVRRGRVQTQINVWRGRESVPCPEHEALFFCAAGGYRVADRSLACGTACHTSDEGKLSIMPETSDSILIGAFFKYS